MGGQLDGSFGPEIRPEKYRTTEQAKSLAGCLIPFLLEIRDLLVACSISKNEQLKTQAHE